MKLRTGLIGIALAVVVGAGALGARVYLDLHDQEHYAARRAEAILAAADLERIDLHRCPIPGSEEQMLCGAFEVYENRIDNEGRKISLNLAILPASGEVPRPDPIFYLMGGPGGAATIAAPGWRRSQFRRDRDIVFVDQRGTGGSNALYCDESQRSGTRPGDDPPRSNRAPSLQSFFEPPFPAATYFRSCRDRLEGIADLRYYTTFLAVDDFDDVRQALGYEQINLWGGSYGSRAGLIFMRQHPESIRAAVLSGIAPVSFTNPLYHAAEAQTALDLTFDECAADPECNAAFPDLASKFEELLSGLEANPVEVTVIHPRTGNEETVRIDRAGFAEGLRVFLYRMPRARKVPLFIHRAWEGNFGTAVQILGDSDGLGASLAMGMLLSVTCSEDIPRIDPATIPGLTDGTFLGDGRVRRQMAACELWPRGWVPEDYGAPVTVSVPTLLFSGTLDPVTGPRHGEEAASHLPHSLHVIVPAAHGVGGQCVASIARDFLARGSTAGVDTSCVDEMSLPSFVLQ